MDEEQNGETQEKWPRNASGPETDEMLMAGFIAGSQESFELIFDRYSARLINFAYRFLNSREEAEDLAQEVFLRIYRAGERYDPRRPFRPWIFSIASRMISNRARSQRRHPKESLDALGGGSDEGPSAAQIADPASRQPAETLEKEDLARRVRDAVQGLPENQRQAVLLARFEEMSYEEIGEVMGLSVSAVKSLLFRARQGLHASLSPYVFPKTSPAGPSPLKK